ncbi:MAG TPA: ABC transporter permease subunit [Bacilli bacterium]
MKNKRMYVSNRPLHTMILPGLILIMIYHYGPMAGSVMAFQKFIPARGWFDSAWIGFDNFRYVFDLPNFYQVLWNTVYIATMKIIFGQIVPIVTALLLNELRIMFIKRTIQSLIYLPHFLSWVILGGVLIDILSINGGLVNQLLGLFGIDPVYFLGNNEIFPFILVISDVWKEFGFATIIYLAALTSINQTLYEAAVVDGANRLRQTWHITLPGLTPIIVLLAILNLGNILNAGFEQVFNLYSPAVYESSDIIDTLVYRVGLLQAQYAVATAIGLFKSVISFILISISYYLAYRLANYRIF